MAPSHGLDPPAMHRSVTNYRQGGSGGETTFLTNRSSAYPQKFGRGERIRTSRVHIRHLHPKQDGCQITVLHPGQCGGTRTPRAYYRHLPPKQDGYITVLHTGKPIDSGLYKLLEINGLEQPFIYTPSIALGAIRLNYVVIPEPLRATRSNWLHEVHI